MGDLDKWVTIRCSSCDAAQLHVSPNMFGEYEIEPCRCAREWRPIETAPKDGSEVLVRDTAAMDWVEHSGTWIAQWNAWISLPGGGEWVPKCSDDYPTLHPTHWAPLPPPPEDRVIDGLTNAPRKDVEAIAENIAQKLADGIDAHIIAEWQKPPKDRE